MLTPVRPAFVPDPSLSREEMASLQRDIAAAATFEDDLPFDPAAATAGPLAGWTGGTDGEGDGTAGTDDEGGNPASGADDRAPVVVGVDQAFCGDDRAISAIVATRGGRVIERAHAVTHLEIPYVPGLLAFREGRPILAAFEELSVDPALALFDGSGRIHFRQAGIATHVGVVLDLPSVGVAKSLLCGRPVRSTDGLSAGERVPIEADDRVEAPPGTLLGYAVQTRQWSGSRTINPLYVSPGHRVGPGTAADLAAGLATEYKLPDPVRLADSYADEVKRDLQ